jgi:hypothetical protein
MAVPARGRMLPFVMMSDDDSLALRQWWNRLLNKAGWA